MTRPRATTNDGTFRNRTDATCRPPDSMRATQTNRPDGTSTVTRTVSSGGRTGIRPDSTAQVTSAIVPWPQAVE